MLHNLGNDEQSSIEVYPPPPTSPIVPLRALCFCDWMKRKLFKDSETSLSSARKGKENYISITNATNQVIDQQIANTLINLKLDLFTTKLVIDKRIDRKSEMGNGASFDVQDATQTGTYANINAYLSSECTKYEFTKRNGHQSEIGHFNVDK